MNSYTRKSLRAYLRRMGNRDVEQTVAAVERYFKRVGPVVAAALIERGWPYVLGCLYPAESAR